MWQFLFACFGLSYANESANSWTWFHLLPLLACKSKGKAACRQAAAGKCQSHLSWRIWEVQSPGWRGVRSLKVCAMMPLLEESFLASLIKFCLVGVCGWKGVIFNLDRWKERPSERQEEEKEGDNTFATKSSQKRATVFLKRMGKWTGHLGYWSYLVLLQGLLKPWLRVILNYH